MASLITVYGLKERFLTKTEFSNQDYNICFANIKAGIHCKYLLNVYKFLFVVMVYLHFIHVTYQGLQISRQLHITG